MTAFVSNCIKLHNINLNDIENVLKIYLMEKHPKTSNGFIIRLSNLLTNSYEERKSYIVLFPKLTEITQTDLRSEEYQKDKIQSIIDEWSNYAIENIVKNYDLTSEMTICSIDPINIDKDITKIKIQYSGTNINPEPIIKSLSTDIIEQMNKHLLELYMDQNYPDIDINDSEEIEQFNEKFDDIDITDLYNKYPISEVYIPINLSNELDPEDSIIFYLNGIISTNSLITDFVDDIRTCLDTGDTTEIFKYEKDDIIFKFGSNKELVSFSIITDPCI
jgi:hypothetical protein